MRRIRRIAPASLSRAATKDRKLGTTEDAEVTVTTAGLVAMSVNDIRHIRLIRGFLFSTANQANTANASVAGSPNHPSPSADRLFSIPSASSVVLHRHRKFAQETKL